MGGEGGNMRRAPTVVIETVLVVRPIKVLGVMCGVIATLLLILSIGASAWIKTSRQREGLWERCLYNQTVEDTIHCAEDRESERWLNACQGLCLAALILTILAIIVSSAALRNVNTHRKYKLYWAGLIIFFLAVGVELISLIVFPIKHLDSIAGQETAKWHFGWAYIIGWCAAISDFTGGLFLLLDRGAEEILYKERVVHDETRNGIEASEDV